MVDQGPAMDSQCPSWAASLGYMGVAAAVCLSNCGSAVRPSRAMGECGSTSLCWLHSVAHCCRDLLLLLLLLLFRLLLPQMGTWKAGTSVINTGIRHPSSVMKNVIPIVMAGGKSSAGRRLAAGISSSTTWTALLSLSLYQSLGFTA